MFRQFTLSEKHGQCCVLDAVSSAEVGGKVVLLEVKLNRHTEAGSSCRNYDLRRNQVAVIYGLNTQTKSPV